MACMVLQKKFSKTNGKTGLLLSLTDQVKTRTQSQICRKEILVNTQYYATLRAQLGIKTSLQETSIYRHSR